MATTYRTKQNEMLDEICWRHYGYTAGAVEAVMVANYRLESQAGTLPIGIEIVLPDLPPLNQNKVVRLYD